MSSLRFPDNWTQVQIRYDELNLAVGRLARRLGLPPDMDQAARAAKIMHGKIIIEEI
jgi:hypothetical protein